jgi:hypothetical protein
LVKGRTIASLFSYTATQHSVFANYFFSRRERRGRRVLQYSSWSSYAGAGGVASLAATESAEAVCFIVLRPVPPLRSPHVLAVLL